ncbi:MAG: T9SS type A sorting domain-containing protein [Candidatus Kapabacteria bacterium]|jgi:hypothetical protein|nr:T9SS type A sorting domain-containing protein [Candidatus Kapabacteria bacterium]
MYGIDWENHVDAPCDNMVLENGETVEWEGPREFTFCNDSIMDHNVNEDFLPLVNCGAHCCYTVVYYDSWNTGDYQVYIAGIFWEDMLNGSGCEGIDLELLSRYAFWNIILSQNSDDFRSNFDYYHWGKTMYRWTPGYCYTSLDPKIYCEPTQHCCRYGFRLNLTPDQYGVDKCMYDVTPLTNHYMHQYNCEPECIEVCDDYRFEPIPGCDMPCNQTDWSEGEETGVSVPGCPGCVIDIEYEYRTAVNCEPEFKDYKITGIDMSSAACTTCIALTEQDIFQYAISYLLKYGPMDPPADGACEINWRVVNAECWKLFPDGRYEPCDADGCCWSQYEVCNIGGLLTYTKIDGSDGVNNCWEILTHVCGYVCDILPGPIYNNPSGVNYNAETMSGKYSYAVPNPSSESTEILFDFDQTGNAEIWVFNELGREVFNAKFEKTSKILKMHVNNNLKSGFYSYKIQLNNRIIDAGSFVVVK